MNKIMLGVLGLSGALLMGSALAGHNTVKKNTVVANNYSHKYKVYIHGFNRGTVTIQKGELGKKFHLYGKRYPHTKVAVVSRWVSRLHKKVPVCLLGVKGTHTKRGLSLYKIKGMSHYYHCSVKYMGYDKKGHPSWKVSVYYKHKH